MSSDDKGNFVTLWEKFESDLIFKRISLADPEEGSGVPGPHGKSQVTVGFLRNSGTDPPREAIGPLGSNCSSKEVRTTHCKIC